MVYAQTLAVLPMLRRFSTFVPRTPA